jgi:tetratricopeptide (TPR) repeat protein
MAHLFMINTADYLGNPVSTQDAGSITGVNDFIGGLLQYQTRAVHVLATADAYPNFCLANVYAGMIWMFLETPSAAEKARPYLVRAETALEGVTTREMLNAGILRAWVEGAIDKALWLGEALLEQYPRDLPILKLCQYFLFNRGDCPGMLRLAHQVFDANTDVAEMHAMIAFAFEQCHLLDEAETAARRAIALRASEPWAHHALAHVMLTQGRIQEGMDFLQSVRPTWIDLNSFMHTHNHWHLALFYLSQGRIGEVLALYDRDIWGVEKSYSQDQAGAISLLVRLEMAGADVGTRWDDVAAHVAQRGIDLVQPFLTLHYVYALARAQRPELAALMDAIRLRADWVDVAGRAAEGLCAYARCDFATAVRDLGSALPRLIEVGGSHAQRDVFEAIYADAMVRAEFWGMAQQTLERRRFLDPNNVPLNVALAQVYDALRLPLEAAKARARASHTG